MSKITWERTRFNSGDGKKLFDYLMRYTYIDWMGEPRTFVKFNSMLNKLKINANEETRRNAWWIIKDERRIARALGEAV